MPPCTGQARRPSSGQPTTPTRSRSGCSGVRNRSPRYSLMCEMGRRAAGSCACAQGCRVAIRECCCRRPLLSFCLLWPERCKENKNWFHEHISLRRWAACMIGSVGTPDCWISWMWHRNCCKRPPCAPTPISTCSGQVPGVPDTLQV